MAALGALAREELRGAAAAPEALVRIPSAAEREEIARRILASQLAEAPEALPGAPLTPLTRSGPFAFTAGTASARGRGESSSRKDVPRRSWTVIVGGVVAAAAALVLGLNISSSEREALPIYGVTASGGLKELRGGAGDIDDEATVAPVQRVAAETELRIVCRPQSAFAEPVAARAFLVRETQSEEIRPRTRTAPSGAIELVAKGSDLLAGSSGGGHAKLRIAIGRPDRLNEVDPKAAVDAAPGPHARWLTVPVDFDRRQ